MKSVRAAQDIADPARAQRLEGDDEQVRQLAGFLPADVSTLQGIRGLGMGDGELLEVAAGPQFGHEFVGAFACRLNGRRRGRFRQRQKDVREPVLRDVGQTGEEAVDLAVGYADTAAHLAVDQLFDEYLGAHLGPVQGGIDALFLHAFAQGRNRHLVAAGDALDGALDIGIAELQAGFFGQLQLKAFQDQPLEDLFLQHVVRRRCDLLEDDLAPGRLHALAQLRQGDDVVVDDRHDAVERIRGLGRRYGAGQQTGQHGQQPEHGLKGEHGNGHGRVRTNGR